MSNVVHLVTAKKQEHAHCPRCGTCVPTRFDIVMVKTDDTAVKNVRGVCFSCPECGKEMVAETAGARSRQAP